jgi:hypothetical protein
VRDLDELERELAHGPIGLLGSGSLLGVDFGSWTSTADEREAILKAQEMWSAIYYSNLKKRLW